MRFSWRIRELNAVDSQDGAEVLDDRLKKSLAAPWFQVEKWVYFRLILRAHA